MRNTQAHLGKIFVSDGLITEDQLQEALAIQQKTDEKLGDVLQNLGYLSDVDVAKILAKQQGLKYVSLKNYLIDKKLASLVPLNICERYTLVPIAVTDFYIEVVISDPLNLIALDDLQMLLSKDIRGAIGTTKEIQEAINNLYLQDKPKVMETKKEEVAGAVDDFNPLASALTAEGEEVGDEEAPVIQLVSRIIIEAFKRSVSDIHVEPLKDRVRVRYRIDGTLVEVPGPPKSLQGAVLSRLKIMSKLDIAEKRLPQDGRIKIVIDGRDVDIRVSTLPAMYGESIVLRLLDRGRLVLDFRELGFSKDDEQTFNQLINIPNGIILVTGPTGSGKTTTLYTSLNSINKPNRKIITVEDPVEYQLPGINQVQIKPSIGLSFAAGLRSILRQAPNVIMIGEIRDVETANIAIEASLTGHLVFSTLHTNDAAGAVTRLIDMGVKSYLVASALRAILAQRLVKKICPACKAVVDPNKELLEFLNLKQAQIDKVDFYKGSGCEKCSSTGYKGRMALFELLTLNDDICDLIYKKASSSLIKERARQCGMHTLREDGVIKVLQGDTTLEEVIRVTQTDDS